jgi:hypothetical protein
MFEKMVIRSRKSKKDAQYVYGHKKNIDKKTNNDLQNTTQKFKDCPPRNTQKPVGKLRCSGRVAVSAPLVTPVTLSMLQTL